MQIIKTLRYHSLLQKVAPRVTYQDWTYCNTLTVDSLLVLGGRFVRVAEIFGLIQLSAGFISELKEQSTKHQVQTHILQ